MYRDRFSLFFYGETKPDSKKVIITKIKEHKIPFHAIYLFFIYLK